MKLDKKVNRRIGQAMLDYRMLADGDRVLVAVSGGVDSLAAALVLHEWRRKAPIAYDLLAVHLDMGFPGNETGLIEENLRRIGIPHLIETTTIGADATRKESGEASCYLCARGRRKRLFDLAQEHGMNRIAFGHQKDDLIETFLLNLFFSGNMSTMVPRQDLFGGRLSIIRPLAYLVKDEVIEIARDNGLVPAKNPCPRSEKSKRTEMRRLLSGLYAHDERIRANLFASLANVRTDYLLTVPR